MVVLEAVWFFQFPFLSVYGREMNYKTHEIIADIVARIWRKEERASYRHNVKLIVVKDKTECYRKHVVSKS